MSDLSRLTKAELISEIERLQNKYEECSDAGGNGKFDEDELFELAGEIEGDELFLVTETGRFVFVNEGMLDQLGYTREQMLDTALPRIDRLNTRAQWLGRVSRLKQSGVPEVFESEQITEEGNTAYKEITAQYVNYRSRNYVLCVGREIPQDEEENRPAAAVRTREETLLQMTSDGVMIVDTRGTITQTNSAADRLLGVAKNEVIGRSCTDTRWRLVDAAGEPLGISSHPIMVSLVEEQQLFNRRVDMLNYDGSRRSLLLNAAPLHDAAGELIGAIGCIRPFDDSAERGDQLQRQRKLQAIERDTIDLVMHGGSEVDLERRFCQLLVTHGDYPLVWRGVTLEKDERLHPSASAGTQSDYLMRVKIRYDDTDHGNGPLGRAMKSGASVVVADTLGDTTYEPWRKQAERSNLHSLLAVPLNHGDRNYGLLTVYAQDRNHFVGPELKTLNLVISLFAYGIAMRRQAADALAEQGQSVIREKTLEALHANVTAAVALFDDQDPFRCTSANESFAALLDEPYKSTGVEGYHVTDFMYAIYHKDFYQRLHEAAEAEKMIGEENAVFSDWQGEEMIWSWRLQRVPGEDGSQRLLYIAVRRDGVPDADVPSESTAAAVTVHAAEDTDDALLLLVDYPAVGPRSKMETRLSSFLEQGRIRSLNTAARRWFDAAADAGSADGQPASVIFGAAAYRNFLEELLKTKESGLRVELPHPEGAAPLPCRVFFAADEKDRTLCLVEENEAAA
ncbi:MAG: PAS domain S-box protein [Bacteroidota bacterium]|nr:PAS domain S-box protein [Bacteroidota bacterium]